MREISIEAIAAQLRDEQRSFDALRLYGYSTNEAATILRNADRGFPDAIDLRDHCRERLQMMEDEHART